MPTPSPQAIAEAANVTPAFARMILAGTRKPSLPVALTLFDKLGYQVGPLDGLNKRDIEAARRMAA